MQGDLQREQLAMDGGQSTQKRNASAIAGAALNKTEVKQKDNRQERVAGLVPDSSLSPSSSPATGLRVETTTGNGAISVDNLSIAEPLISDNTATGISLPGIAGLPHVHRVEQTPEESARLSRARHRLRLWMVLSILLVLTVLETIALSPWTDPIATQSLRQVPGVAFAEVNQFGVNVFLHKEVDLWKRENTLQMAQDMGAKWIKQQFPWAEIEFAPGSYWDPQNKQSSWIKFDNIVDLAEQHGLRIIARIDSTPDWAKTDASMSISVQDDLRGHNAPPSSSHMAEFQEFIRQFVSRYKGRVAAIQVWNEPNLDNEWYPTVNAEEYVTLLKAAHTAAKSEDPNMIVLAAPLASNLITEQSKDIYGALNEMDYLQAMYNAGAKPYFDAMSANPYGKDLSPEDPPSKQVLNFRRVELLRKVMEENRDGNKAIWFNEYGWNASPADCCASLDWGRVTPEQQADYTMRGIEYARQHWPWAGVFTIWYLRQVGDIQPTDSQYYFGLLNTEFVPNPTYWAVKKVAHDQPVVAAPGRWGPLSPQVSAGAHWQVRLDTDVPGQTFVAPSLAALDSSDSVSMLFQGTDVKLTLVPPVNSIASASASTDVHQARYYVTVDGSSNDVASGLQRDDSGRAYIDLPEHAQTTEVTLVQGLGAEIRTGQHELRITAGQLQRDGSEAGQGMVIHTASPLSEDIPISLPGIGVFTVEARRSYVLFTLVTALLLAFVFLNIRALWRSRSAVESAIAPPLIAEGRGADGR